MSDGREEREEQEKRRELQKQQPRPESWPESCNPPIDPSESFGEPDPWEPERGGS